MNRFNWRDVSFILVLLCFTVSHNLQGQSDTSRGKKKYFGSIQSGALIGCRDCEVSRDVTFSFQTTHGVQMVNRARAGISVGFDAYPQWQAVPLQASVSYDVIGKHNPIFVDANYGWGWAWRPAGEAEPGFHSDRGGQSFSFRLGYRITQDKISVAIVVGYKEQSVEADYRFVIDSPNVPPATVKLEEKLKTLSLMLAVGW